MKYRYHLEKYSGRNSRFVCPKCNKKERTFTRYIDAQTKEYIADSVGKCGRESKCGYHLSPSQYFSQNGLVSNVYRGKNRQVRYKEVVKTKVSFIPRDVFSKSLNSAKPNYFISFLTQKFGDEIAKSAIERYQLGTSKKWNGATVFWQIDLEGNVRTGKIMLFNEQTCKRVQTGSAKINWVHSVLKLNEFHLSQCFFGDHLLVDESKVVAIVESEKTAVIASIYFPQFIWIAVGGVQNLNWNRLKFLSERNVHVFPDLGVYTKWKNKIESFSFLANFRINNFLELHATAEEKADGLDLADYLLKFDLKEFRNDNSKRDNTQSLKNDVIQPIQFPEKEDDLIGAVDAIIGECWDGSYDELELYFSMLKCDIEILHLDKCTTIMDFSKFVKSHLLILKEHWNKRVFRPFLDRLLMVKLHLKDEQL